MKAREYNSPVIQELIDETTPEQLEQINKQMEKMIPKFKVGDKLEALDWHKEEYSLEYVTITSINEEKQVYHWEVDEVMFDIGGKISSGYYFHEAIEYKEK
jgi:transposase-like protein